MSDEITDALVEVLGVRVPARTKDGLASAVERRADSMPLPSVGIRLPPDLQELWTSYMSVRLFIDSQYGQWGLELWDADRALRYVPSIRDDLADREAYVEGDVVVGEFLGDSDLLLVRCNPDMDDFGQAVICLPIDGREDWPTPWPTLRAFLADFAAHHGEKFWPH